VPRNPLARQEVILQEMQTWGSIPLDRKSPDRNRKYTPTTLITLPILPRWVLVSIRNRQKPSLQPPNHHKFTPDPKNQSTLVHKFTLVPKFTNVCSWIGTCDLLIASSASITTKLPLLPCLARHVTTDALLPACMVLFDCLSVWLVAV